MRAVSVLAAVVAGFLVAAAPADAGTLRGFTHRGMNVKVTVDATGAEKVTIFNWSVRHCDRGLYHFSDSTAVVSKTGKADNSFHAENPYTIKDPGGLRSRVTVRSRGHKVSLYRWEGSFQAAVTIRKHGRVVDHCRFHRLHWAATAPQARVELSSDPGDYILQGKSYSYGTPANRIGVTGDRHRVAIATGPWTLLIKAPAGRTLKPGHFPNALREPFSGRRAGVELAGDGRGCNEIKGEFTVKRAKFDKRGVKALTLSFVQHCEGGDPASRGTVTYHR